MVKKEEPSQKFLQKAEDLSGQLMVKLTDALAGNALNKEESSEEEILNWDETLARDRDPKYRKNMKRTASQDTEDMN